MSTNPQTLTDALKSLENRVTDSYVDGWKSYWKLVTDVARDPSSLQSAHKEYLAHITQAVPNHVSKTVEAGFQVYSALVQSGGEFASQLYNQTAKNVQTVANAAASTTVSANTQAAPVVPAGFNFEGYAGETLSRRFLVSNNSSQTTEFALSVTSFVPDLGDAGLILDLDPQTFSLAPSEEKVVECRVTIPATLPSMTEFRSILSAPGIPALNIALSIKSLGVRELVVQDAPSS